MRVLIAIDSFKGCASSKELALAIKKGISKVSNKFEVDFVSISDGGEGLLEVFGEKIQIQTLTCKDPLGREIQANYGIKDNKKAIIEVANSIGLYRLKKEERDPSITSSYSVGELIKDAYQKGIREFIIGLGGSSTNDAGLGMLRALGYKFLDNNNQEVKYAKDLSKIVKIDFDNVLKGLNKASFLIASDVNNPLCGKKGASFTYGAQKGASKQMLKELDFELNSFANLVKKELLVDFKDTNGAGAAGGLGFAFLSFLNAQIEPGINVVIKELDLENKIKTSDVIISGEGKIDNQSLNGKVVNGIAKICKTYEKPCIVLTGDSSEIDDEIYHLGVGSVFSIQNKPMSLSESMQKDIALNLIAHKSEQIFRLIGCF
ncbi:glycerate kinase [Sulfurospirillum sp. 1307]|jgi:glycerate kinase